MKSKTPAVEHQIKVLAFNDIWLMLFKLFRKIKEEGYHPDIIIGIARGGYVIARIFCDLFDVAEIATIGLDFYTGIDETREEPIITQELSMDISEKMVLLVDDVADTGKSLELAVKHLKEKGFGALKTVTIHYKPKSIFKPDFFLEETSDWLVYPWEQFEFARQYLRKRKNEGASKEKVANELQELSLPEIVIREIITGDPCD